MSLTGSRQLLPFIFYTMRLDDRQRFPSGMEEYLEYYGWHFSKKMCEWAVSKMYKIEGNTKKYIDPISKDQLDGMMKTYGVKLECKFDYDCVFVANMAKADFLWSTLQDERQLLLYVKDYTEDPDGYEGLPFTRFYADCIGSGIAIPWEDVI